MSNPIIKGFYADPDIACFDGKFYIYPTTDGGENWNSTSFKVFSSDNLTDWKDEGVILDLADVPWTGGQRAWAPAIDRRNGKYYFYYSGNNNIGAAVSDSPTGKFIDIGRPLVADGAYPGVAIDPDVFTDEDGASYLYWGNGHMYAAKLSEDMTSFDGEPVDITPPDFREGSCVFKRNGIYYYTWCMDDTRSPDYHVRYGKGTSPMQKPEGNTVILSRRNAEDSRIKCTGHHTVLNIPGTDEWYIAYHRFNIEKYGDVEDYSTEAGNHRELCIDRLEFDKNGDIIAVKPTLEGITPVKVR
ncbi:MAG: family 43 glycosylhydrolase [Candidatus Ornithomonoglobus sp.]